MTQKLQNHLANGYDVKISDYITKGYEIFKKNIGGFVGFTLLYFFISALINRMTLVNGVFSLLLAPCLVFGYYLVAKKTDKGIIPDFGMFFKGFDYFSKLIVIHLILVAIVLLLFVPVLFSMGFSFVRFPNGDEFVQEFLTGGTISFILLGILVLFFLFSCWIFAPLFAVFHDMQAWDAMEMSRKLVMKNWLMIFLFLLALMGICILGALCCGIGLLVAIPVMYCAMYEAFKDLAGFPEDEKSNVE